jgi:hypothetical protein
MSFGQSWKFSLENKMRGHMLEVELNSLDLRNFDNIQDLFKNFNSLILHLNGYNVDKSFEETQLIISMVEKLSPYYVIFISYFHINRFTS